MLTLQRREKKQKRLKTMALHLKLLEMLLLNVPLYLGLTFIPTEPKEHFSVCRLHVAATVVHFVKHVCSYNHRVSMLDSGNLRIWNATKSDAGLYTCVARNQFGVASSSGSVSVKGMCIASFICLH